MKTDSNIEITRNDSAVILIPVEDTDTDGYLEFLGMTVVYHITTDRGGGDVIHEVSDADAEMTIVDVANIDSVKVSHLPDGTEVIRVELTPEMTGELTNYKYFHECEITDQDGTEATVMQGRVLVRPSST